MTKLRCRTTLIAIASCGFVLVSCEREIRSPRPIPPAAELVQFTRLIALQPGAGQAVSPVPKPLKNDYENNAPALSEGQRLYKAFNCNGCHANGGGGIGPPLMDSTWIYGSSPAQVFSTIVEGRPNGMPSWGGRIPEHQIWELVAYVRSMSGQTSKEAAPGRTDEMSNKEPEASRPTLQPVDSSTPPSVTGAQP